MAGNQSQGFMSNTKLSSGLDRSRSMKVHLEKPRPLRLSVTANVSTQQPLSPNRISAVDDLISEFDSLAKNLSNGNFVCDRSTVIYVARLCSQLKSLGSQLETKFQDTLDRNFVALRNACRDDKLDMTSKMRLLELIELRAAGWRENENTTNYYKQKFIEFTDYNDNSSTGSGGSVPSYPQQNNAAGDNFFGGYNAASPVGGVSNLMNNVMQIPSLLGPNEMVKSSGKFTGPTRISGKNYFKDEIIIRNSDSGKVMGIKGRRVHVIEEMSETVISFQRVNPGAKDRMVQITGPSEECIDKAKQLVDETIRRNASPVRSAERNDLSNMPPKQPFPLTASQSESHVTNLVNQSRAPVNENNNNIGESHPAALQTHTSSPNNLNLGTYFYTVHAGNEVLKIAGSNLNVIQTAKLVLEEFFTMNDPDTIARQSNSEALSNENQNSAHSTNFSMNSSNSSGPHQDLDRTTRSYSQTNVGRGSAPWRTTSSSKSSSYVGSGRLDPSRFTNENDDHRTDFRRRQNSTVLTSNNSNANLNNDRPQGDDCDAKMASAQTKKPELPESAVETQYSSSMPKIVYSRACLLEYSANALSKLPPRDVVKIGESSPDILKDRKAVHCFDGVAYQRQPLPPPTLSYNRRDSVISEGEEPAAV